MSLRSVLGTAVATAAAVYLFDPVAGRRRQSLLRDKAVSALVTVRHGVGVAARDLAHRAHGLTARACHLLDLREVSDEVLVERVRAALGREVSHPGAIDVAASQGRVSLSGPVLAHEHARLLRAVAAVRGVESIEDRLEAHRQPGRIPALQGGRPRAKAPRGLDENWPPALRLVATTGGIALVLFGWRQRGVLGLASALAGSALLLRGATNSPLDRLAGARGRRAVDIHKSIHIDAPVEEVFETLSRCETFPAIMRNVRRVSRHPDGRSHWVVDGPAGVAIEWDAETTVHRPNEMLAWRTVRNAAVEHAGIIRFERDGDGTRLDIRMTYNPPAGAFGHALARLLGADAKTELDEDLMRLKSFLETGVQPHDAAARGAMPPRSGSHARSSQSFTQPEPEPRAEQPAQVQPSV